MQASEHQNDDQKQHQRQSNFVLLRSLESLIPSTLFNQVLKEASKNAKFPQRIDWTGKAQDLSFDELKTNFSHIDQNYLSKLIREQNNGNPPGKSSTQKSIPQSLNHNPRAKVMSGQHQSLVLALNQRKKGLMNQKQNLGIHDLETAKFERMKTIFGHASLDADELTAVFSTTFDQEGKFVISGADDGLIKIWDRDTMTLQASLHGHNDVITDLDVSKCNRFLASSSKDGVVFIWDFQKCIVLDKLTHHTGAVNNLKFFQFKLKSEASFGYREKQTVQVLVTCSDDGTIKVYDFRRDSDATDTVQDSSLDESGQTKGSQENQVRRTERLQQNHNKKEKQRGYINCQPDEFRQMGVRGRGANKAIKSITLNEHGILVGGTHNGEVYLWKVDLHNFQKKNAQYLGSYRKHQKDVLYTEFSPNGLWLATGSQDGNAMVWNLESEKVKKFSDPSIVTPKNPIGLTEDRLIFFIKEHRKTPRVDFLAWSCKGRYLIVSQSFQEEVTNKDLSVIKVWDSVTKELNPDLAKDNEIQLHLYTLVVAPHPKYEEILMTGSEGGLVILWNIRTRKLIKKFIEYGAYSLDNYTLNDPFDGKFSPDGQAFIIGTQNGTLSLFSNEGAPHKYAMTRVEQFFIQDGCKHNQNIYDKYEEQPKICNQNLIPYEHQPPCKFIGKFKNKSDLTNREYERQLHSRVFLAQQEEEIKQSQIEEGQRENYFINELEVDNQQQNQVRRPEERKQQQRRIPRREVDIVRQGAQAYIERIRNDQLNLDPDNEFYDRQSDENFSINEDDKDELSSESYDESEQLSEYKTRYEVKRENYHEQEQIRRKKYEEDIREQYQQAQQEKKAKQQNNRSERAKRRAMLKMGSQDESLEDEESEEEEEEEKQINTRSNRRKATLESDESMEDEEQKTRNGYRKNSSKRRQLQSSDEESALSLDEDDGEGSPNLQQKQKKEKNRQNQSVRTRGGKKKVNYKESGSEEDDDYMDYEEPEKQNQAKQEEEKGEIELPSSQKGKIYDVDYEILNEDIDSNDIKVCAFCQKTDQPIIGPFCKVNQKTNPLYFHKDCIEVNLYSRYDSQKDKWVNIGKALDTFVKTKKKEDFQCYRCGGTGATIPCGTCKKFFHGFYCSQVYQIYLGGIDYQCFNCRNAINYKMFSEKEVMPGGQYEDMCKHINRDWLLQTQPQIQTYVPQLNDLVYYFFQGHEKFITTYNCFFYCGDEKHINFEYPWRQHACLLQTTLCRVTSISYSFPSKKALSLIKKFGKGTIDSIIQTPQIIARLSLQIVDQKDLTFELIYFPNELPAFLILKPIYDIAKQKLQEKERNNTLLNGTFTTKGRYANRIKVTKIVAKEETLCPYSEWETIHFQQQDGHGLRRSIRREHAEDTQGVMNFWELNLGDQEDKNILQKVAAFEPTERERLINVMQDFIDNPKNTDRISPFLNRIDEAIAADYRCHVPVDSYLNLAKERILNNYYRSQEQLFFDLDLISYNARIYNGEGEFYAIDSKQLMEKLRCELKRRINCVGPSKEETKYHMQNDPGKLTLPLPKSGSLTSFEQFLKQSSEEDPSQAKQNNICRNRASIEETKNGSKCKLNGKLNHQNSSEDLKNEFIEPHAINNEQIGSIRTRLRRRVADEPNSSYNSGKITIPLGDAIENLQKHNSEQLNGHDDSQDFSVDIDKKMLGKRNKRQNKVIEDSYDKEEMQMIEQHLQDAPQPEQSNEISNSRYPKRLRKH